VQICQSWYFIHLNHRNPLITMGWTVSAHYPSHANSKNEVFVNIYWAASNSVRTDSNFISLPQNILN